MTPQKESYTIEDLLEERRPSELKRIIITMFKEF
jgi:hypothetical protein